MFQVQLIAEVLGTYFVVFAGCGAVVVNLDSDKTVSFPGISIVWGLVVMVMVYSVGHISGAHFNPAVTLAFATCKRFPWKQVIILLEVNPFLNFFLFSWKLVNRTQPTLSIHGFSSSTPHPCDVKGTYNSLLFLDSIDSNTQP